MSGLTPKTEKATLGRQRKRGPRSSTATLKRQAAWKERNLKRLARQEARQAKEQAATEEVGSSTLQQTEETEATEETGTQRSEETLVVWHFNVRGWRSKEAEVTAVIRLAEVKPDVVCLNETFLETSLPAVELEGYKQVARRDRTDDSGWGGVAVLVKAKLANRVVLVHTSETAERLWLTLHTNQGPYLLCCWYRLLNPGEINTLDIFFRRVRRTC